MLNSSTYNTANLYGNLAPMIGGGVSAITESPAPYCNSQIGDSVLQQFAKSMNYYNHNNPPLKDDSGLTFNNNALPFPRKRPREISANNNNCPLISSPACKISGQCNDGTVSFLGDDLSLQMMQQQFDIDRLISLHMEKVRQEMEERRRKQANRIIQTIQESVSSKLKEKEDQIEKIGKLNWALEERIKSICVENQIWRDLAQTNEATANALRSNLEQIISQAHDKAVDDRIWSGAIAGATDDAESCCGSNGHGCEDDGDEVNGGRVLRWRKVVRGERVETAVEERRRKRMCRSCGGTESSVLLLPCRHLCLCSACGPVVETCPICNSAKTASVHVNLC
ncbi:hypothetical protein V2J09_008259 [Rumex salicifolius]